MDSVADICDNGFGTEMERIRGGNKINRIDTRNVHNQPTKLKIIAQQVNNLTKLYYIVFTITI